MNSGKSFEQEFKKSVEDDGFYYHRLNDPAQSFNSSDTLRFSPKNPYDCFIYAFPYLFTLELKSTLGTSMTFYREDFESNGSKNNYMIKKHQIHGLQKASKHEGVISGFVLNFRKSNHTYFLLIENFFNMTKELDKKSFNENDVIKSNGYLIDQSLKRTKYKFHIQKLIANVSEEKRGN